LYNDKKIKQEDYNNQVDDYNNVLNLFNSFYFDIKLSEEIVKTDTSNIKSDIEKLIIMGKIPFVDKTTNAKC
jgi:hypothetical protein